LVLGVEGDFSFAGLRGNAPCLIILSCQVRHDWVADITGRVGVVAFDRALVYIKGGAAWAESNYNISTSIAGASISGSVSTTRLGGLLGFGVEYPFLPRWDGEARVQLHQLRQPDAELPDRHNAAAPGRFRGERAGPDQ
jgi:outer membrane immunogenic protein